MESASVEHRHGSRRHFPQEVMAIAGNDHRLCHMHNLSDGGVLLEVSWGRLTHDVEVEIIIDLPVNDILTPYHLFGKVTRVTPVGTAVQFTIINSEAQKALQAYLTKSVH